MAKKRRPADPKAAPKMSIREAGRKGGLRVREKYGHEFYVGIGAKGGRALADKRGSDYFSEIGKKGGDSTLQKHGVKFYSQIGSKSAGNHPQ